MADSTTARPVAQITSPEHVTTLLDRNGYDAWAAVETGDDLTARTEFRDPSSRVVYELAIRPVRIDRDQAVPDYGPDNAVEYGDMPFDR